MVKGFIFAFFKSTPQWRFLRGLESNLLRGRSLVFFICIPKCYFCHLLGLLFSILVRLPYRRHAFLEAFLQRLHHFLRRLRREFLMRIWIRIFCDLNIFAWLLLLILVSSFFLLLGVILLLFIWNMGLREDITFLETLKRLSVLKLLRTLHLIRQQFKF